MHNLHEKLWKRKFAVLISCRRRVFLCLSLAQFIICLHFSQRYVSWGTLPWAYCYYPNSDHSLDIEHELEFVVFVSVKLWQLAALWFANAQLFRISWYNLIWLFGFCLCRFFFHSFHVECCVCLQFVWCLLTSNAERNGTKKRPHTHTHTSFATLANQRTMRRAKMKYCDRISLRSKRLRRREERGRTADALFSVCWVPECPLTLYGVIGRFNTRSKARGPYT